MVTLEAALSDFTRPELLARTLRTRLRPLLRDPRQIPDLLSYTLVSGVTAGYELSEEDPS